MSESEDDDEVTCLTGPVEELGGELVLRIPLEAGGGELVSCSRGIGHVVGDELQIRIPSWLATKLGIHAGMLVTVDNRGGKFNIYPQYGEAH